jgi:hypothetical protein
MLLMCCVLQKSIRSKTQVSISSLPRAKNSVIFILKETSRKKKFRKYTNRNWFL